MQAQSPISCDLRLGDCKKILRELKTDSIDLVFTSPPYAGKRANSYDTVAPDKYVEWFLPISWELLRVLKPTGTFVLNIKEQAIQGERHTYVLDLISAMRRQGWFWTEEFIWHKKNSFPGKWPNRFRDSWERLLQFNKNKKFHMYQEEVMVPTGDWAKKRLGRLSDVDKTRDESRVGSGFGKNISNWVGRDLAYPTNVLHMATECGNQAHSAAFPVTLPRWFIKLFTRPNNVVLDPFSGSGTTLYAGRELGRKVIGIEINSDYYHKANERLQKLDDKKVVRIKRRKRA